MRQGRKWTSALSRLIGGERVASREMGMAWTELRCSYLAFVPLCEDVRGLWSASSQREERPALTHLVATGLSAGWWDSPFYQLL
jgi:hypothetical protein